MKKNKSTHKRSGRRFGVGAARLIGSAALVMSAMPAAAFEVDTGNPDVKVRWDNTLKYNAGWRAEGRDDKLGDAWIGQATNHGWDTGDMVTNRFDLLTEFDFIYKESHGFRVSAVAWNDFAYSDRVRGNPKLSGMGETAYPGNKFTKHVERWYKGSGELLDAFVFTKLNVGSVPTASPMARVRWICARPRPRRVSRPRNCSCRKTRSRWAPSSPTTSAWPLTTTPSGIPTVCLRAEPTWAAPT